MRLMRSIIFALIAIATLMPPSDAPAMDTPASSEEAPIPTTDGWSPGKKAYVLQGVIAGTILGYSIVNWQTKENPEFEFVDDGWFELSAPNAGADKSGHAFSTYVISRVFSAAYRKFGVEKTKADWQGPASAWSAMVLVELVDAFQQFGFSYKDIVANSAGAIFAFVEERHKKFDDMVDYRVAYMPSDNFIESGETDILTDYSGMKHLLVFKLSGVDRRKRSPASFVEFHAGYFTTGTSFAENMETKSRNVFAGVSLNFSRLFEIASEKSKRFNKPLSLTSKVLEFYQLPYVSLDIEDRIDSQPVRK